MLCHTLSIEELVSWEGANVMTRVNVLGGWGSVSWERSISCEWSVSQGVMYMEGSVSQEQVHGHNMASGPPSI